MPKKLVPTRVENWYRLLCVYHESPFRAEIQFQTNGPPSPNADHVLVSCLMCSQIKRGSRVVHSAVSSRRWDARSLVLVLIRLRVGRRVARQPT